MVTLYFSDTHSYRGCRVRLSPAAPARSGKALAEFSDGSVTLCDYEITDDGDMIVVVGPYATGKRTRIGAKTWRLARTTGVRTWRVVEKMA